MILMHQPTPEGVCPDFGHHSPLLQFSSQLLQLLMSMKEGEPTLLSTTYQSQK